VEGDYKRVRAELERYGQAHLLRFWPQLNQHDRRLLLDDLAQLDLARCAPLIDTLVRNRPPHEVPRSIEPAPAYPATPAPGARDEYERAREAGRRAIAAGQVAAFTVAGGQGTRLGFDGPKGAFPISPVRNAPLVQLFAESLLGVERRYGCRPRWYVMTSPGNHADTLALFERHGYFGLRDDNVRFFPQRQMPAFHRDGRIAMTERHRVLLSPDGHGGSLWALAASGALADMQSRGIEHVSYFQVDNPLVHPFDPLFIGLHALTGSEMSSKAVSKVDDVERVGNFCLADGRLTVIEYSDMPESLARARNSDGSRRFDAGNIAVHVLARAFVERLAAGGGAGQLPWHRADKQADVIDEQGPVARPTAPNVPKPAATNVAKPAATDVVKLETFVFDAIPQARNPLVLFTSREEEFSPVKNREGTDSPATARHDLVRRAARWLEACGRRVPRRPDGEPQQAIEISPAFALDLCDLRDRGDRGELPEITPGRDCLLA
jgi:UDP-N-acetylglucosamine/UDP-N-acetylgalactosamine diphosphorylase